MLDKLAHLKEEVLAKLKEVENLEDPTRLSTTRRKTRFNVLVPSTALLRSRENCYRTTTSNVSASIPARFAFRDLYRMYALRAEALPTMPSISITLPSRANVSSVRYGKVLYSI